MNMINQILKQYEKLKTKSWILKQNVKTIEIIR